MINTNELMLNNIITAKNMTGYIVEINEYSLTLSLLNSSPKGILSGYDYDICNPIPLSPAVLEACGFKKDGDLLYWIEDGISGFYLKCDEDWTLKKQAMHIFKPKYLHQLQNYFSIVGQPLEIDIEKLKMAVV